MNAGVIGPQSMDVTAGGVTIVFATNVLGHVVLLEGLLADDRLGEVAVVAGSEAARGLPKLRMKRPSFVSTSTDELATVINGTYFANRKPDFNLAFGQVKYIGALWMAYLARQYPDRRFITVSCQVDIEEHDRSPACDASFGYCGSDFVGGPKVDPARRSAHVLKALSPIPPGTPRDRKGRGVKVVQPKLRHQHRPTRDGLRDRLA